MKAYKTILFGIIFLFSIQKGISQEIDLGLKLGANFATLGDLQQFDNEIGFVGGAYLDLKFGKFGIQPELLYSQQDGQFDITAFDLNYVNIPVMFKFYIVGGLNLQLGPQFGILVNDSIPDSISQSVETESFDLAGTAGLGLDLPLGLRANARYVFNVENDFETANFTDGFFTLSLGFNLF
jgi:hypothetical protein